MAKITARGDRETHRWTNGEQTLVFTAGGRLLIKRSREGGYALLVAGRVKTDYAMQRAAALGLEPTATRS